MSYMCSRCWCIYFCLAAMRDLPLKPPTLNPEPLNPALKRGGGAMASIICARAASASAAGLLKTTGAPDSRV